MKRGTLSDRGLDPDAPVVTMDDSLSRRKPDAGARELSG
jgi:hypothetical protein